jgi:hypothetical protein
MDIDNLEKNRRAKAITNLDQTLKEVLIIRNNMAKDVGDGNSMLVFKEVTRYDYDLSGQNPLVNFRAAVREMKKVEKEDGDKDPFTFPISSVEPFNVRHVKKALEHYCDGKGVPTGKRGVFKPFIPGFTRAKTIADLHSRISETYNLLSSQGAL